MNYLGSSMYPTLRVGDGMKIVPYSTGKIQAGDVVVFRSSDGEKNIVHRVISLSSSGIITRGDNNPEPDTVPLTPDDIMGRVVSVNRGYKTVIIHGGTRGEMRGRLLHLFKIVRSKTYDLIRPFYYRLLRSDVFKNMLSRHVRILCFKRPEGTEKQLLIGSRVIGRHRAGWTRWQIRRPFRLFIDEAALKNHENHEIHEK
jgi:signal peptidase